jgi:hypothetical protein
MPSVFKVKKCEKCEKVPLFVFPVDFKPLIMV